MRKFSRIFAQKNDVFLELSEKLETFWSVREIPNFQQNSAFLKYYIGSYIAIIQSMLSGDSDIVEETVAVIFGFHRMMAGRTNDCHAILDIVA